jgi:hypothetical protein
MGVMNDFLRCRTKASLSPTTSRPLAKYLGFTWRDVHPSGAASIEWFDRWGRERDPKVKQQILYYNKDDCRPTRILLDGIRKLSVGTPRLEAQSDAKIGISRSSIRRNTIITTRVESQIRKPRTMCGGIEFAAKPGSRPVKFKELLFVAACGAALGGFRGRFFGLHVGFRR